MFILIHTVLTKLFQNKTKKIIIITVNVGNSYDVAIKVYLFDLNKEY